MDKHHTRRNTPGLKQALALLAGLLLVESVAADSIRCGQRVIKTGDDKQRVLEACGKPAEREIGFTTLQLHGLITSQCVERWIYPHGSSRSNGVIVFGGDVVIKFGLDEGLDNTLYDPAACGVDPNTPVLDPE